MALSGVQWSFTPSLPTVLHTKWLPGAYVDNKLKQVDSMAAIIAFI